MLIDRAERFATWSHGKRLGVAPLPGSERVFDPTSKSWVKPPVRNAPSYLPHGGGWLAGVRRGVSGSQLEAAIDFIRTWPVPRAPTDLARERAFPMLPFRISQMSEGLPDPTSAADVDSRLWSDAVSRTLLSDRVVPGLRIPGAEGYLEDLDKGRAAALGGRGSAKGSRRRGSGLGRAHQGPRTQAANLALSTQLEPPGHVR